MIVKTGINTLVSDEMNEFVSDNPNNPKKTAIKITPANNG